MLFGALFQYVHGIFTQLAHRMHQPQAQPLGDLGFKYLPVRCRVVHTAAVAATAVPAHCGGCACSAAIPPFLTLAVGS